MTRNVCGNDKIVRSVMGLLFILGAIVWNSWIFAILGIILLLTVFFSFCPINKAVNYNSCRISNRERSPSS
ncbi:MAG: DUF2892 domain-containing protein [Cytophagaceae bacterium]